MFYVTTCTLVYKYTGMTLGGRKEQNFQVKRDHSVISEIRKIGCKITQDVAEPD